MIPNYILRNIDYFMKGYNVNLNQFIKTKNEMFRDMANYWYQERINYLDTVSMPHLTDEEYINLPIF